MANLVMLAMAAVMGAGSVSADDHALLSRMLAGASGMHVSEAGDNQANQILAPIWIRSWGGEGCESRLSVDGFRAPSTWIIDWRRIVSVQYDDVRQNLILTGESGGISIVGGQSVANLPIRLGSLIVDRPLRAMERIQAACRGHVS